MAPAMTRESPGRRQQGMRLCIAAILVLGMDDPEQVDAFVDKALAAGATPAGTPQTGEGRYQRGFADLDGHHWEALCLVAPDA